MAVHLNVDDVVPEAVAPGVQRRVLLHPRTVPGIRFELGCLALDSGTTMPVSVGAADLEWLQVLSGSLVLDGHGQAQVLSDAHVVFLPPGFDGSIRAESGASILWARVPDAAGLDPAFTSRPPGFRIVNWKDEPLLESQHDARKRIYLATPALFGTEAIKGEMILYPPGTEAPKHYHLGAAHFMYFLEGGGTAFAGDRALKVRAGDVVYYDDQEVHSLRSGDTSGMTFAEFFVPAGARTVWVHPEKACTWLPTGKNIQGGKPAREIRAHSFARVETTTDV
ncbi:MAG: cupin domain-containing protein [Pseudomonadota bacterium]